MKISIFLLIVVMSLTTFSQWSRTTGPEGVAMSSLANINGTVYAGTEVEGVYVSSDDGMTWTASNTGIETYEVTSIVSKPGYIFAATFGAGVYRSTDGGQTWMAPSNGTNFAVGGIVIDDEYIFAATISEGVQRSSDNGVTWEPKLTGLFGFGAICKSGNKVIASSSNYTLESTDHGETWSYITSLDGAIIFSYYCIGDTIFAGGQTKIYRSTNNGNNFTTINLNLGFGIVNIYAITSIGSTFYAATSYDGVYKSTDFGSSWIASNTGMGPKDVRALTVTNLSTIIAGTNYVGVYRSTDMGDMWNKSVSGFPAGSSILSMLNVGSSIFAGTRDGAYRTDNNGESWTKLTGESDTINYCDVWAMCEFDGAIYASMQLYFDVSIYKSTNKGANWIRCGETGLPANLSFMKGLVGSGTNLVAGTDEGIYYSVDGGNNWNATNIIGINIPSITSSGNYVYAAIPAAGGVYRSIDNGVTWSISLPSTVDYVEVAAMDNYAFAGSFFGGARYSTDFGGSWFTSNGWPSDASIFVLHPMDDGMVLAGTDLDPTWIYASTNYGNFYEPYSEGLAIRASVEAFAVNDTFMFAGTDDHGVWRRYRPGVVSVNSQVELPLLFNLDQNYPNPFNPVTTIRYSIPVDGEVSLTVFNTIGEKVETLVSEYKSAGQYEINFDASQLPSGIYFYKLRYGTIVKTKKMILLK